MRPKHQPPLVTVVVDLDGSVTVYADKTVRVDCIDWHRGGRGPDSRRVPFMAKRERHIEEEHVQYYPRRTTPKAVVRKWESMTYPPTTWAPGTFNERTASDGHIPGTLDNK